jgi:hypothetical protein
MFIQHGTEGSILSSLQAFHPDNVGSKGCPNEHLLDCFLFTPAHRDDKCCSDLGQGHKDSHSIIAILIIGDSDNVTA